MDRNGTHKGTTFRHSGQQGAQEGHACDGGGLYLQIASKASRSWVFLYKAPGRESERYMGLGPFPDVTLAKAREAKAGARAGC